jgi:hypothetical protein
MSFDKPIVSKSYPFLSIAKHYGVPYADVLILADEHMHGRHSNGLLQVPCRAMSPEWQEATVKVYPMQHILIKEAVKMVAAGTFDYPNVRFR